MRTTSLLLTVALLAMPAFASAQALGPRVPAEPPAQAAGQGTADAPYTGGVELGGLFTGTDGDAARYERYKDLRDGVFTNLYISRLTDKFMLDASANHVGYRDQRYDAAYIRPKFNFDFSFTGIPLNYSYITRTPYTRNGGVLTLDDNAQRAVQGPTFANNDGTAVGVPCAPGAPPASCSNPSQADQAKANRSIYNDLATQFDLRHTRNIAAFGGTYNASKAVDVDASFTSTSRKGEQPWGASFAFNTAIELPKPIDERTNDLDLGLSWGREKGTVRVGYLGSWYNNKIHDLTWDNPDFINDYNNGRTPPDGPYDPSGYSNGNGPAMGREALPPDNSMHVFSVTGVYKLWTRTTLNGAAQFTTHNQNDTLIPWTVNSLINSPTVIAAFPHLAQIPRDTAEAKAKGINTLLNFTTRTSNNLGFNVRYRYNQRDVQTPIFDATEYVRFDAVPEENEEGFSPQFDNHRHLFDATASYTPARLGTVRVGYSHEQIHREGRGFADAGEHTVRASWDTYSSALITVRASVDQGWRRGTGYVSAASGTDDTDIPSTGPGGVQPTSRYYDEADRDRTRGSLVLTVMPSDKVDLFVQFSGGKDNYLREQDTPVDTGRENELFGLLDSNVTSWNFGVNYHPADRVSAGVNYGYDTYHSFQKSRNANPPPDPTWTDPSRDWMLDNDDKVNFLNVYADLLQLVAKTDVRLAYELSDSGNSFVHSGPRIASLQSAGQFIPLPDVTNTWHRFTVDAKHFFKPKIGVGVGYYFEKLNVEDFSVIDSNGPVGFAPATGVPRIDWLGVLLTGYGARPYTGNTVFARLLYKF
jgi:MtrB/PioB family decaheme-associated outer membrane protein